MISRGRASTHPGSCLIIESAKQCTKYDPGEWDELKEILMLLKPSWAGILGLGLLTVTSTACGAEPAGTRLLTTPAITEGKIAFVYADDLWVADSDGTNPRRLTSHPGEEQNPFFAPDGKHIAFTASYDGNEDVYVLPTAGGEPRRLSWHPGDDIVRGFTPDGKVLFASQRAVFSRRHSQFFTVGIAGGAPEVLPVPTASKGAISPDGKYLAYTPLGEVFRQWKNYRGGTASRIWVLKLDDLSHEEIPKPESGCNDTEPMWIGETVYFLSDRDGEFNLYAYNRDSKKVACRTRHNAFPIASASAGAGKVIYEQAGWIHVYEPGLDKSRRLPITVAADLAETRSRYATGSKHVRNADVSPSGKRAVIEYRGEIITLPAKKGDPRNLSHTPGSHERSPVWSPDGKSIAYFTDATGEYALVVRPQDGKGEARSYLLKGAGFYERPVWSPDSRKIAFIDNSRTIYWIDLQSGTVKRIAADSIYGPINTLSYAWSPDSRWLAYTRTNRTGFQTIQLYELGPDRSYPLTDGLIETGQPAFDASGKYLYFLASTDAGPVKNWFDQSFTDMRKTDTIYLVTLAKSSPNPIQKESDEESAEEPKEGSGEGSLPVKQGENATPKTLPKPDEKAKADSGSSTPKVSVVIDLESLSGRIVALPVEPGRISNLVAGGNGQIYYIRRLGESPNRGRAGHGKPSLKRFDLKTREEESLADGIDEFRLSADHKKILYRAGNPPEGPNVLGLVDAGKFAKGDGALSLDSISVPVEPRAEWAQILHEAWRINRDYFYAPNMHGADWNAVRTKYEEFLPSLTTRGDLSRVIRMMLSELAVGHSNLYSGERLHESKPIPVGLLGADYEVAKGRYRFKTIFGGAYWDPALRAPLLAPGVDVKAGEFLLAVDGREIKADSDVYRQFEGTAGKRVEIQVSTQPDGSNPRMVVVEPIPDEYELRNRAWVEANLRRVHDRTQGRVAYVYVPNTAEQGYTYFKRLLLPAGRQGSHHHR